MASGVVAVPATFGTGGLPRVRMPLALAYRALGRKLLLPQEPRAGAAAMSAWLGWAHLASLPPLEWLASRQCMQTPLPLEASA